MPANQVVGIDGYRGGWIAAILRDDHVEWATARESGISALLPRHGVTAVDMPIGLLDAGERECDALARSHLPGAASRVFSTPPRKVLELGLTASNDDAQRLCRALTGKGVSRQALGLASRILALDDALAAESPVVIEAHPEVSFCAMSGGPPLASKKSAAGVGQRLAALRPWLPSVEAALGRCPSDVPIDDALDALACLWTAERWAAGTAMTIPEGASRPPFIAV